MNPNWVLLLLVGSGRLKFLKISHQLMRFNRFWGLYFNPTCLQHQWHRLKIIFGLCSAFWPAWYLTWLSIYSSFQFEPSVCCVRDFHITHGWNRDFIFFAFYFQFLFSFSPCFFFPSLFTFVHTSRGLNFFSVVCISLLWCVSFCFKKGAKMICRIFVYTKKN